MLVYFALPQQEVDASDDVLLGTTYIISLLTYMLFDCGATHSFISQNFFKTLDKFPDCLVEGYQVGTPEGKYYFLTRFLRMQVGDSRTELKEDLIKLGVMDKNLKQIL